MLRAGRPLAGSWGDAVTGGGKVHVRATSINRRQFPATGNSRRPLTRSCLWSRNSAPKRMRQTHGTQPPIVNHLCVIVTAMISREAGRWVGTPAVAHLAAGSRPRQVRRPGPASRPDRRGGGRPRDLPVVAPTTRPLELGDIRRPRAVLFECGAAATDEGAHQGPVPVTIFIDTAIAMPTAIPPHGVCPRARGRPRSTGNGIRPSVCRLWAARVEPGPGAAARPKGP